MEAITFISTRPIRGVFTIATMVAFFLVGTFAQQPEITVMEGKGLDSISIGESSEADVVYTYGNDYKLIQHGSYSYEMLYKKLGMSFYYCAADPAKEIFVVELQAPARALTNKGIRLGESTVEDVFRIYGKPEITDGSYEYEGIYFFIVEDSKDEDAQTLAEAPDGPDTKEVESQPEDRPANDYSNIAVMRIHTLQYFDPVDADSPLDQEISTNDVAEDGDEDQDEDEDEDEDEKEMNLVKSRIVRRIELIEKSGLRQCESKFEKNATK